MVTCDNCGDEVRGRGLSGRMKCYDCGRMVCPTCRVHCGNDNEGYCSHGNPLWWKVIPLTKELENSIRYDLRRIPCYIWMKRVN